MRQPEIVSDYDPYPRYPPGEHIARVIRARKYRHPLFKKWKCELELQLMDGGDFGTIHAFLHLGEGNAPHVGRNSNFRHFWTEANGAPPRKRQVMSLRRFIGVIFKVEIVDVRKTFSGQHRGEASTYSVCKLISCLERPSTTEPENQLSTQPS